MNAATQLAGTGRQPDLFDIGASLVTAHTDMFTPYKVATWADIPDGNKEFHGTLVQQLHRLRVDRLRHQARGHREGRGSADAKYKGKVALNGDPLKASAGFNGVVMAALANGGSADNICPGVDFFKKLADSGNLIPVDPNPGTIAAGTTPIVIDWTYNNGAQTAVLAPKGITWKTWSQRRARRRLVLQRRDQQGRGPSRGRPLLDGVHILRRRPECVAEGLRPADPTRGDAEGRDRRRGSPRRDQSPDDSAGPADAGAVRRGHEVPHRQLEVHRHQVAAAQGRAVASR